MLHNTVLYEVYGKKANRKPAGYPAGFVYFCQNYREELFLVDSILESLAGLELGSK